MSRGEEKLLQEELEADMVDFLASRAQQVAEKDGISKNRRVNLSLAREHLFMEQFETAATKIFKNKVTVKPYVSRKPVFQDRILNVVLSDLHFHSLLDPREVPMLYGPVEEARRLSAISVQVAEYKRQYRPETTLYVHLLGDIIQGQLHDMRDGAPLAEQAAAAMHLLSQQIAFFSSQFPKVVVRATPGNHGRNTARHRDRATNQKFDSIENIIYFGIKTACAAMPNVEFEIGYRPYYIAPAFDKRGFFTHGDTVLQPGYPGKTIDVANVRKQINEINAAEGKTGNEEYSLFVVGHVHVGSMTHLPNGAIFMSNGCLIPPDAYAVSIGIFETQCGQWIWESVKGHIVGDARFATVDANTDKEKALDKIIQPYLGW